MEEIQYKMKLWIFLGVVSAAHAGLMDFLPASVGSNFEELVKAAAATCELLPLDIIFARPFTMEMPYMELVEFTRSSQRQFRALTAHARLTRSGINEPLILYVPGWWNTPTDDSSKAIVNALLQKNERVIVLDTTLSFCRGYVGSASRVKAVANLLYGLIRKLTQNGVPLESIHIIGFSLGAHVAGMTGRMIQKNMKQKLERITALDPAKPCFARSSNFRLDRSDAKFVQVIHSSAGVLGLEQPIGHVDVYMNGVYEPQPECRDRGFTLQCDHAASWRQYSASVRSSRALMAPRCQSWTELQAGSCSGNMTVLGYSCSPDTKGMFLYKSAEGKKRSTQQRVRNFNPFNFFTWFT